ncbi:MAG: prohibitin family protein [Bacteroidota bacterium]
MKKNKLMTYGIFIFIGLVLIIALSNSTFLTIKAGEKGVLFRTFGGGLDTEKVFDQGFHIVAPWNEMHVYDVRESQLEESMTVLSSNGLNIKVDVTVRLHPAYASIGFLHDKFGNDYSNSLIRPEVRSAVRKIIGRFEPEELYSTKRDEVQALIQEDLSKVLADNYITLKAALIRDIELPEKIRTAIERKLQQEQESEEYKYRLDKERQEAERKIIEAEAKAEANRIISASLTDKILRDKGIEATLELSNSPNSKVIVVGSGDNGLPLILGGQ